MRLLAFFMLFSTFLMAQEKPTDTLVRDTSRIELLQVYESFDVPRNFRNEYRIALQRVKRVYPLALHAAKIIDSLDREIAMTDKRRKQNKVVRQTKKELMDEFKFVIRDLYVSEGKVLTKLIYRETGMTVREIIREYKNGFEAFVYDGMAGLFEQNLDAKYDPQGEDFVIECVVQDLLSGKVPFDPTFETIDRGEFKESKREARQRKREYKKKVRQAKKESSTAKDEERLVEKKNSEK